MNKSRTYYAKNNIAFGTINKLLSLVFAFIVRTIIISTLGAEYLGLGSLFSAIISVLGMAELGFSSAIIFKMYKPFADEDENEICALLSFYKKAYLVIGCVVFSIGLIILPFLKHLIKGTYPADINIYFLFILYIISTTISYFGTAYKTSLLDVAQRRDIISNVDTIILILRSVMQIVFLYFTRNYYFFLFGNQSLFC